VDKHDPQDKKDLGRRLAACREMCNLKQEGAARELGITKAALSAWETGRNMPDALMLKKIAKLYGVSADAILWENSLSIESIRFAAHFDSLSEAQKTTLATVVMAFVQPAISDEHVERAYAEAQRRERGAKPPLPVVPRMRRIDDGEQQFVNSPIALGRRRDDPKENKG
jgi:transcriptional regulator with XRE-family HTH domain